MKHVLAVAGISLVLNSQLALASEAKDIARSAFEYLGTLNKFAFKANVANDDMLKDEKVKNLHSVQVKVARPDRFFVRVEGNVKNKEFFLNKGLFTMIELNSNYYGQVQVDNGGTIDSALDYLFDNYDIQAPLAQLLYSNSLNRIQQEYKGKSFGRVNFADEECEYVIFWNKEREVHIWISASNKPLIKRFIIVDKTSKEQLRSIIDIKWDQNSDFDDSLFDVKLPQGAMKIEVLRNN